MKRFGISVGLIVCLIVLSLLHVRTLSNYTTGLTEQLQQAQTQLLQENWDNAATLFYTAFDRWEDNAFYLHVTLHHAEMDAIRNSFREAAAFLDSRDDATECAAVMGRLCNQLELLLEAELPSIKNLL